MLFQKSLIARLTWLYGLSTAALLIVVSILLYSVLTHALDHESKQQLERKLNTIKVILMYQNGDQRALGQEVILEGENLGTRILTMNGQILLESPWLNPKLPASAFPKKIDLQPSFEEREIGTKTYLLASERIVASDGRAWVVQAALDINGVQVVLQKYQHYLLICILGGIVLAMTIGYTVARRGLYPLNTMAQAAERITATQLHERLNHVELPIELKTLAQTFDAMLMRLEDAFQRLSQFSADLAHELRTPLNNLMGEAEVALARTRTTEEYQLILSSSLEEYGRLARMLESLLFLARTEHSQTAVNVVNFDGRAALESLVSYQGVLAEEQSITLRCDGQVVLQADPELFRRAVNNLLSNALRHTPSGGSVSMSIHDVENGTEIMVQDTGVGIAAEHLARLGERFYRAGSLDHFGSGLGLAIVRSIMDLHVGHLKLDSTVNQGTRVTLFFPKMTNR